ncbi:MAG: response regulator [Desulfobacteraceae bacterium]|nr:response regulator [Desulfobacteraceae bacterium]
MKVLIVDDELVSRKKMEVLVQSLGYELLVGSNGLEAWEMWKAERPRLVITDWLMPGLDGPGLCTRIRKAEGSRYTYLIMVSAKTGTKDCVKSMKAGADDFITKPFIKEELAVRIQAGQRIIGFETRDLVIFSMAKLAESRDPETGNHLERIRFYSRTLANAMAGLDDPHGEITPVFIENIFLTSPLHDIGKIGIPDYVLLKPGRFDDEEFEIMKSHATIGFETLNEALKRYPRADYLRMSADIALCHHEKFDGTGYPQGLSGEKIPLSARIVALADVYDALISKRVYKQGMAHDMARDIILKGNGRHFDPRVVEGFLACEEEFIQIFNRYKS